MLDENLKEHCKQVHGKPKLVKGQKTLSFYESLSPRTKKNKTDDGGISGTSKCDSQPEAECSNADVPGHNIGIEEGKSTGKSTITTSNIETSAAGQDSTKLDTI